MQRSLILGALAALVLSGCGGGAGSSLPATSKGSLPPSTTSASCNPATAICIAIPQSGTRFSPLSSRRHIEAISAAAASLTIAIAFVETPTTTTYSHTFNIATDCPQNPSTHTPVCSLTFSSFPTPPPNASGFLNVTAQVWSGTNASGTLLDTNAGLTQGCFDPQANSSIPPGISETCAIVPGGIMSTLYLTQRSPIIANGTPSAMPLVVVGSDPAGYVITDTPATGLGSCYMNAADVPSIGDYFILGGSTSLINTDPNATLSITNPYYVATPGLPSTPGDGAGYGCSTQIVGSEFSDSPSDIWTLNDDGTFSPPNALQIPFIGIGQPSVTLSFAPLVVPAKYVTISGPSGAAQTLTVTPPSTYSGPVSLSITSCNLPQIAFSPSTPTPATETNASSAPLVTISPASAMSTNGSSVTFTVSATGTANDYGTCTLTSSADGSTYGAVVSWPIP